MKNLLYISCLILFTACANSTDNSYDDTADLEFLEENAQREDVTVTESGLQYRIIEEGEGDSPGSESIVFVEYTGRLVNDEVFDQTEDVTFFNLDQVIPGLSEGLQLMNEGALYELVVPTELAFNNGKTLIIEIELNSFLMDQDEFLEQNALEEDVEVTDSGLQYRVIEEGDGEQPGANSEVSVIYTGTFTNGLVFDSSESDAVSFNLDGVIPGFSEGVQLMNEGAVYELFVPSDIGYGNNTPQNIPQGAVLVFEVELTEVDPS